MIAAGILGSMGYKLNPRLTTVDPDHFNLLGQRCSEDLLLPLSNSAPAE